MPIVNIRRNRNRRGQALVESALVSMVFLIMLIGILDVGQVLFVHQTLVERTRAALRYGAVRPFDAAALKNVVLYNQPSAPTPDGQTPGEPDRDDHDSTVQPGLFGLVPAMIEVTREDATFHEDRIVIRITNYPFRFYTPLIAKVVQGKPIVGTIPYEGS